MSDNDSNQSSNSNDNYQAMPEEEEPKHVVVVIPDLAPPDMPHDEPPTAAGRPRATDPRAHDAHRRRWDHRDH